MANINGLNINGDVIETSPLKGLFTVPATIDTRDEQFDINITWISPEKEKLQVDVYLISNMQDRVTIAETNGSYIVSNTEDKVIFKGVQGTELYSYYLVSFTSSTTQRLCKILLRCRGSVS